MKKKIALLLFVLLIFSLVGCTTNKGEIEEFMGYIAIMDNVLHLRHVEIVKLDDKERMDEFNLYVCKSCGYTTHRDRLGAMNVMKAPVVDGVA